MFAVIETGGKQVRVQKGDKIKIEKLNENEGSKVVFDKVLLIADGEKVEIGKPFISGMVVFAQIIEQGKDDKITVFKFKAKKRYQKKQGHRQSFTRVEILDIVKAGSVKAESAPAKAKAPVEKKTAVKKAPVKKAVESKAPSEKKTATPKKAPAEKKAPAKKASAKKTPAKK